MASPTSSSSSTYAYTSSPSAAILSSPPPQNGSPRPNLLPPPIYSPKLAQSAPILPVMQKPAPGSGNASPAGGSIDIGNTGDSPDGNEEV